MVKDYKHLEGKTCHTPFEPSGLVKVIDVSWDPFFKRHCAYIEYVEDHPHGYKKGEYGLYFADQLTTYNHRKM